MTSDVKGLLRSARRPERTVDVCLRGDLQGEWEALERRLASTARAGATSLEGDDRVRIAEQMEQLRREMADAVITFRIRALPRDEFRALERQHPPRQTPKKAPQAPKGYDTGEADEADVDRYEQAKREHDDLVAAAQRDLQARVNTDTFYPALLRACVAEPALDDEDWTVLLDTVTDQQFDELAGTAIVVNRGEVSVPFSPTASRLTRTSAPS